MQCPLTIRWCLRFRLRALFAVATVLAISLAWFAGVRREYIAERNAIGRIRTVNGELALGRRWGPVANVSPSQRGSSPVPWDSVTVCWRGPSLLRSVCRAFDWQVFHRATEIQVCAASLNDDFRSLPQLEVVRLSGSTLTMEQLLLLQSLSNLRDLTIVGDDLTNEMFRLLLDFPNLEHVQFIYSNHHDARTPEVIHRGNAILLGHASFKWVHYCGPFVQEPYTSFVKR